MPVAVRIPETWPVLASTVGRTHFAGIAREPVSRGNPQARPDLSQAVSRLLFASRNAGIQHRANIDG